MERDLEWVKLPADPEAWGLHRLEVVSGAPQRDWLAESRLATLEFRERELRARELRLTITGYVLAASICLEVVLALVVMAWGNRRLPTPLPAAAKRTGERPITVWRYWTPEELGARR